MNGNQTQQPEAPTTEQRLSSTKKLVIEFDGVKRDLAIPFRICASRETLIQIARAVNDVLAGDWCYGWLDVTERPKESRPNTKPIGWHDHGSAFGE
jgi:hypothetical protein